MKRKLTLAILLLLAVMLCAPALAESPRVYDQAELFTSAEKLAIEKAIASFQDDTGMDFVVVTSIEEHEDVGQLTIAEDFYDRGGFGLDDERSGVLYYIDMYTRLPALSTTGKMQDYMTDERGQSAHNECKRYLSSGDYAGAVELMISIVRRDIQSGIPEGQFRYDVITGQRLTARHKVLELDEIIISAVIALVIGLIFILLVRRSYKLKGSTYHYAYADNSEMDLRVSTDDYLRTTTTRTRKSDPPSGGGSGGIGGGGGSGVHIGSSGTSHGGSVGGRF